MVSVTLQALLEAGTHFGHQTKRWNPKMKRYILCERNGIYIVDLNKTVECLDNFLNRVRSEAAKGGKVLFVGTKKQIKDCICEEAQRCKMPYVSERWLGGMLTNYQTIRKSIGTLEKIEKMESDGTFEGLTKKERLTLLKRKEKLVTILTGIRSISKLPAIVFVVDAIKEHIAIDEAKRLRIPIGAIVDTNCDPELVDYPIPGNDDAIKSVQLITRLVADTIVSVGGEATLDDQGKPQADAGSEALSDAAGDLDMPAKDGESEDESQPARKHRVVRRKIQREPVEE